MPRAEQPVPRRPPVVTVTGGAPRTGPAARTAPASARGPAVLVGALALAAGVAVLRQPPPPPPAPVEASLRVLGERIATSLAGVVVVPVETDNPGPAVVVEQLAVRAEPVRQTSSAHGVARVRAGSRGGFAVVVQPDCGVLAPPSGSAFTASLTVTLRTGGGARRDLRLDLDQDPAVAARVDSLCGLGPRAAPPVGRRPS